MKPRNRGRRAAILLLAAVGAGALAAGKLFPEGAVQQNRVAPTAPPSLHAPLGTDELGRNRMARVLFGGRISLGLAPLAAVACASFAVLAGTVAAWVGGWPESVVLRGIDLMLCMPWVLLLTCVRGVLPLDANPVVGLALTYTLLAALGWPGPARIARARARQVLLSDFVLQARAAGLGARGVLRHVIPNLKALWLAQLWLSIPVFILTEAELGVLGLGVAEPLPSWGNVIRESLSGVDWSVAVLAPALLVIAVVSCFRLLAPMEGAE